MPNHVTNIIYAPRQVLESLINDEGCVDFNEIICFQGKFEWNGVLGDSETAAKAITNAPLNGNKFIADLELHNRRNVNALEMSEESFEQFVQMLRNKRQTGFFHPMDFAREKWGTKWNAYSQKLNIDDGFIQFDTAWRCPVALIEALSIKHPRIEIVIKYADEDLGSNCGKMTIKAGLIVEHEFAGKWSDMSELAKKKWVEFAKEVTGRVNDEEDDE